MDTEHMAQDPNENSDTNLSALQAELVKLKAEAENNYSQYLRAVAEADNTRKRFQREQANALRFGLESFFRDLLPVLDSFDKAIEGGVGGHQDQVQASSMGEGFALVRKQLFSLLEKNGLMPLSAVGEKFNPECHQAIRREDSDAVSEETVSEEYAKGYMLFERLLRPAMVAVKVPTQER